ncbi:MAG: bifunctional tetrahydrofolate synthase/dihydrofolate synthase [Spongiibacteraceae bacterium]
MSASDTTLSFDQYRLDDWLAWMEAHHPRQIELGLDRIRTVANRLSLTPNAAKVITVGGTNGKGSCAAFLENILRAQGYRVGVYTSPHLLAYNERVRIDGDVVGDADFCAAFRAIHAAADDVSLTYFEYGTLAALWLFSQTALDVWVLEVGLGGRLDAVNLIDADVAVLTTIDLDHQDWLGDDRETIGREKAGIFRRDRLAICVDAQPPQSVLDTAAQVGAKLLTLRDGIDVAVHADHWRWQSVLAGAPVYDDLPLPSLPLPSAVAALTALHALAIVIDRESIQRGLIQTHLPGRFQRFERDGVEIILDVAHNPQAAHYLAQRLRDTSVTRTLAVFELMQDKDAAGIVSALHAQIDGWYIGELADNPRAAKSATLTKIMREQQVEAVHAYPSVDMAFVAALAAAHAGDRVVVFGSFFTVAAVLHRVMADSECIRGGEGAHP